MRWHNSILIAIYSMLLGCSTGSRALFSADDTAPVCVEENADQSFVGNSNALRASDGFRQNCWLSYKQGSLGAVCMDLDHQRYLVVDAEFPIHSVGHRSQRFSSLQVSIATLRKKMHPEAFILDRDGIDWISRIPPDAEESFAADLFNELFGLRIKPTDIRYGWD
jgi:hypothetical protein